MKLQYYIIEDVAIHRNGGNDVYKVVPKDKEISKIKYKNYNSLRLFKPWGSKVPTKSIRKDTLAFLIESRED